MQPLHLTPLPRPGVDLVPSSYGPGTRGAVPAPGPGGAPLGPATRELEGQSPARGEQGQGGSNNTPAEGETQGASSPRPTAVLEACQGPHPGPGSPVLGSLWPLALPWEGSALLLSNWSRLIMALAKPSLGAELLPRPLLHQGHFQVSSHKLFSPSLLVSSAVQLSKALWSPKVLTWPLRACSHTRGACFAPRPPGLARLGEAQKQAPQSPTARCCPATWS